MLLLGLFVWGEYEVFGDGYVIILGLFEVNVFDGVCDVGVYVVVDRICGSFGWGYVFCWVDDEYYDDFIVCFGVFFEFVFVIFLELVLFEFEFFGDVIGVEFVIDGLGRFFDVDVCFDFGCLFFDGFDFFICFFGVFGRFDIIDVDGVICVIIVCVIWGL